MMRPEIEKIQKLYDFLDKNPLLYEQFLDNSQKLDDLIRTHKPEEQKPVEIKPPEPPKPSEAELMLKQMLEMQMET